MTVYGNLGQHKQKHQQLGYDSSYKKHRIDWIGYTLLDNKDIDMLV